jgi:hypothetical protein
MLSLILTEVETESSDFRASSRAGAAPDVRMRGVFLKTWLFSRTRPRAVSRPKTVDSERTLPTIAHLR